MRLQGLWELKPRVHSQHVWTTSLMRSSYDEWRPMGSASTFILTTSTVRCRCNGPCGFEGGHIVFATKDGFSQPDRVAGSATIHDNRIAHGVTQMKSGVRYSLFFLDHGRERRETFNRNTTPPRGKELTSTAEMMPRNSPTRP